MTLNLSDLPPALRAKAEAQLGVKPGRSKRTARGRSSGVCSCGLQFASIGPWERHHDAAGRVGHSRYSISFEAAW